MPVVVLVRLLRDGFALTAMGRYRPFADLAAQTLRSLDPDKTDDAAVETVLGAFRQLDPHPDVEPALRMLHDAGLPAVTLTNGNADLVGALLARAGTRPVHRAQPLRGRGTPVEAGPVPYLW